MAMVNMNNLLNGKDSRWLQLEVCREFQRQKCTRPDTECKFAHPPANVEVQNGRVTACYDSIKGRCNREKPPCKYFHPPQHLKDQLLINGRNHLALKNALMQQMGLTPGQPLVPGQVPTVATNPYLTGMPQVGNTYSPYFAPSPIMPTIMGPADPTGVGSPLGVVPQTVAMQQKLPRTDRLEMDMKSVGSLYYENFAFPGMVPFKRPAGDKSGVPVYQPTGATTYQQLMQLQQPFVPVSCEYTGTPPLPNQNSNQSVVTVQNSLQSQANSATNSETVTNGLLADSNNPPPPPPACATNTSDKQAAAKNNNNNNSIHESDTTNNQSSHELNHRGSPQLSQLQQAINAAAAANAVTSMHNSNLTSLSSFTAAQGLAISSLASSASPAHITPVSHYTVAGVPNINVLSSLGMSSALDPAALAKEVAQKNYAKALKLSQATYSAGLSPLNVLNYTGVALNKQSLPLANQQFSLPASAAAPRSVYSGLTGIPGAAGLNSPLHAGILAYQRPQLAATVNPYSIIKQQVFPGSPYMQSAMSSAASVQAAAAAAAAASPYLTNPYSLIPGVHTAMPQLPAATSPTISAQPQVAISASSGVIVQPYKKMKTT